jgi:hypothetical protein
MTIVVDIKWVSDDYPNEAKAFGVSIYAKQSFSIKNYAGDNYVINMDGSTPSGFLNPP